MRYFDSLDISKLSVAKLAGMLRNKECTSTELTQYCIDQHEEKGQSLNAYREWSPKRALALAQQADKLFQKGEDLGCLQGIPISVKDLYGIPGYATFAGCKDPLPKAYQAAGPIIKKLQKQLAVIMGKTHTVQFAYGGLGINHHWGTPRNPFDQEKHRSPGGSSSGAGVSLCEGSAFVALGTDTAGSVRVPASYTGTVGLKTSSNRWSTKGIVPLSPFLDTAGILGRDIKDVAVAYHAIDYEKTDFYTVDKFTLSLNLQTVDKIRIGVDFARMWETCEQSIQDVCHRALRGLEEEKCEVREIDLSEATLAVELRNKGSTISAELTEFISSELPEYIDQLDPVIRERIQTGDDISAVEFLRRKRQIRQARQQVKRHFADCDFIASPTVPLSPPTLEEIEISGNYMPLNLLALQNTTIGSFLDLCSITVPVGFDRLGLPVGLQLMGPAGCEELLLSAGLRLQRLIN